MITVASRITKKKLSAPLLVLGACYAALAVFTAYNYLQPATLSFIAGMMSLLLLAEKSNGKTSLRYAIVAILFVLIVFLAPVKTFLYFSLCFALFYLFESLGYRLGFPAIVALFLITPVSEYAANVFSFPVRLKLSSWVATLLSQFANGSHAAGNLIVYKGREFSVDPECMGLNMLIASLLVGLMTIGYFQRKLLKKLSPLLVSTILLAVVLLNILSNLTRMIILVVFSIAPGNPMHEITGLICLLLYVMLPVAGVSKYIFTRFGKQVSQPPENNAVNINWKKQFLVVTAVATAAVCNYYGDSYSGFKNLSQKKIPGYELQLTQPGIVKLENRHALVYVKFIRGFYDSDHNPTICWKGSGYDFTNVQQKEFEGLLLNTAILKKGNDKLYTAWWYSNGTDHTVNPFAWRWHAIKTGTVYSLVNVTASSEEDLKKELDNVISKHSLSDLYK